MWSFWASYFVFSSLHVLAQTHHTAHAPHEPSHLHADNSSSLSQAYASSSSPAGALDPRSPEFRDILAKLAKAAIYLKTHGDIMDSERYEIW